MSVVLVNSELQQFDYILSETTQFDPIYFYLAFKRTFDTFMILNDQVFNCNLYNYLFPHAFNNTEVDAVLEYIKTEKPTNFITNDINNCDAR